MATPFSLNPSSDPNILVQLIADRVKAANSRLMTVNNDRKVDAEQGSTALYYVPTKI